MPEPTAPAPAAAPAPAQATSPDPTQQQAAPADSAELERLRRELQEYKVRDGRARNEKGVLLRQLEEFRQMALQNSTDPAAAEQPTYAAPPQPFAGYQPQPAYAPPPQPDVVTREEWDLDRFRREQPTRFEPVRQIAQDPYKVQPFIRYRADAYNRAVVDVYGTYSAIAQQMELEELRKAQPPSPQRNPALGVISGSGAASYEPTEVDVSQLTPDQLKEKFPEAFPPQPASPFANWGK